MTPIDITVDLVNFVLSLDLGALSAMFCKLVPFC